MSNSGTVQSSKKQSGGLPCHDIKSDDNKTATMAQAGIYGVGELTKVPHSDSEA